MENMAARSILLNAARQAQMNLSDPNASVKTIAEALRQQSELVLREIATNHSTPATPERTTNAQA